MDKHHFCPINAPEIVVVPIVECHEPLVDLVFDYPDLCVDLTRAYAQSYSASVSQVRKTIADKLLLAQALLPDGVVFKIIEGYRPVTAQRRIFTEEVDRLASLHPDWTRERCVQETSVFVAPPIGVPPHSTGAAIDITLMTTDGVELDMGSNLNESYSEACFTDALVSYSSRFHRNLLIKVLQEQGFVNYPAEWWHWSYGDRYWAFVSGAPQALYGSI